MSRAPLRFLAVVLLLWAGVRAAILWPGPAGGLAPVPAAAARAPPALASPPLPEPLPLAAPEPSLPTFPARSPARPPAPPPAGRQEPILQLAAARPAALPSIPERSVEPVAPTIIELRPGLAPFPPRPSTIASSHWSLSAWLLVRDERGGPTLAPGGTLGGSQAGARLTHALGGGVSLSARAYLPLRRTAGAELAAGLDWRPISAIPVNLLAERRQRLGREGRSAFAFTAYGGTSRNLTPRIRIDAYGQAGMVGTRSRDLFADGALRLSRRVGPVELGAGAWGAAQPGAARLDAGPSLSWRLPVRSANLRVQADWRFRIGGDAAPRSGPALTLATDF